MRRFFLLVSILISVSTVGSEQPAPTFKVYLESSGVYAVTYERLVEAGLMGGPWSSDRIGVRNFGQPVTRWVSDGGDRVFGPGDRIEFVGSYLRGTYSTLDEYSRFNCYVVGFNDPEPRPGRHARKEATRRPHVVPPLLARQRVENDVLMVRYPETKDTPQSKWYWARLALTNRKPFRFTFPLHDLNAAGSSTNPSAGADVVLRIGFRGWSEVRRKADPEMPDHRVDVKLNGADLETSEWNGKDHHVVEVGVAAPAMSADENVLEIQVPKRAMGESGDFLVDVVLLDWIEVVYPRQPVVADRYFEVRRVPGDEAADIAVRATSASEVKIFIDDDRRLTFSPAEGDNSWLRVSGEVTSAMVVPGQAFLQPDDVVLDHPSALRGADNRADYIMISHRSLMEAVEPLAELYRARGLTVEVVDVEDTYDEFNHGVLHPRAIRDFLSHAYHEWAKPAPRFVLLVGDASWDFKNRTADDANYADWTFMPFESRSFIKNASSPYADGAGLNNRNLVPTWSYPTYQGHAASDNWYVCVDGDDSLPDMALGRFPAVSPAELRAMVDKTIGYVSNPELGPWRRNMLLITNESRGFQVQSDSLADRAVGYGVVPEKIYPSHEEAANEHHSQRIVEAFDAGLNVVHFLGHGGRYIWRTGPPDLKKNHDLFTLEHLDRLQSSRRLPVVLSLTCYSAPFDHPTADSIGEKLLRIADRGAIGVFAASWRNSPAPNMGWALFQELARPGATIGEAIMRAKAVIRADMLVQTYNLIGDPAVPMAMPPSTLALAIHVGDAIEVEVKHEEGRDFTGRAVVELVDAGGETVAATELMARADGFTAAFSPHEVQTGVAVHGARAYVWNDALAADAMGSSSLEQAIEGYGERIEAPPTAQGAAGAASVPGGGEEPDDKKPEPDVLANTLRWTTASEVDNFGFDIYRGGSEEGPFKKINQELLAGAGTVDEPQNYVYVDETIDPDRWYYYYIESISTQGVRERFSPIIAAKPKSPVDD